MCLITVLNNAWKSLEKHFHMLVSSVSKWKVFIIIRFLYLGGNSYMLWRKIIFFGMGSINFQSFAVMVFLKITVKSYNSMAGVLDLLLYSKDGPFLIRTTVSACSSSYQNSMPSVMFLFCSFPSPRPAGLLSKNHKTN